MCCLQTPEDRFSHVEAQMFTKMIDDFEVQANSLDSKESSLIWDQTFCYFHTFIV